MNLALSEIALTLWPKKSRDLCSKQQKKREWNQNLRQQKQFKMPCSQKLTRKLVRFKLQVTILRHLSAVVTGGITVKLVTEFMFGLAMRLGTVLRQPY